MAQENLMIDHVTNATAGVALTTPLWLQTLNPYIQFIVAVMGGVWLGVQIYYKIKNERRRKPPA